MSCPLPAQNRDRQGADSAPAQNRDRQGAESTYLITFVCYGSWLPGRPGAVARNRNQFGSRWSEPNPAEEIRAKNRMKQKPYLLDALRRQSVLTSLLAPELDLACRTCPNEPRSRGCCRARQSGARNECTKGLRQQRIESNGDGRTQSPQVGPPWQHSLSVDQQYDSCGYSVRVV
jgi:hypothetical protein